MGVVLKKEEKLLCLLLRKALTDFALSGEEEKALPGADWDSFLALAERHKVLPLLYEVFREQPFPEEHQQKQLQAAAQKTVKQSYRLLFLTRYLVKILEEAGIPVLVLKGCGVAAWYPVPEYRKAGDIDLGLADMESAQKAAKLLEREGFLVLDRQQANHHIICGNAEGICAELHILPVEPFDNKELNDKMRKLQTNCIANRVRRVSMGVELPVPPDDLQAVLLLLHMLQHFLRAGFGVKLLCDWVVFWNRVEERETAERFVQMAEEMKIDGFARAVTLVCEDYLGLEKNRVYREVRKDFPQGYAEKFMTEIMEAEEFGRSDSERMVVLRSRSPVSYLREFHHQMRLNYPKDSEQVWRWPALWIKTFVVFLKNNRRLDRGGVREILKKAGERAELVEQMGLFTAKNR